MTKVLLTFLSFILHFSLYAQTQKPAEEKSDLKRHFDVMEIQKELHNKNKKYEEFLNISSMKGGIYYLRKEDTDYQKPHDEDELYYVTKGKAKIKIGTETIPVEEGSIIFVEAHKEHKFFDITEDLVLVVFFSTAAPADVISKQQ